MEVGVERGRTLLQPGIGGTIFGHVCGRTPRRSFRKSRRAPSRFGVLGGEASVGDVDMVLTSQCQLEWCCEQSKDQKTTSVKFEGPTSLSSTRMSESLLAS
jgi:hypothetical protein